MMCAPNNPCAHDMMPSTWSCQNTVPESTSEYHRYWTNSTDTGSPAWWLLSSGRSNVIRFVAGSTDSMVRISMFGVPAPTAIAMPGRSRSTWVTVMVSDELTLTSSRFSRWEVYTDCSKLRPVMTPSEASGSNCTKWVCMFVLTICL